MPSLTPTPRPNAEQYMIELARAIRAGKQRPHTLIETVHRYFALQLMGQGLRESDIRHVCAVSEYHVRRLSDDLQTAPTASATEQHEQKRHRGGTPGVWSLCYRPAARIEAAQFATEWVLAGLPFTADPNPADLYQAYQAYRFWNWDDEQRQLHEPSACLALLRLVHAGELSLAQCLFCEQFFVHPGPDSQVLAPEVCPFCHRPHKQICAFDGERRVLQPH